MFETIGIYCCVFSSSATRGNDQPYAHFRPCTPRQKLVIKPQSSSNSPILEVMEGIGLGNPHPLSGMVNYQPPLVIVNRAPWRASKDMQLNPESTYTYTVSQSGDSES